MGTFDALSRRWGEDPDFASRGWNEAEVAAAEQRLAVSFPESFRDYLLSACPRDVPEAVDDEVTSWWLLDRIETVAGHYEHPVRNPDLIGREADWVIFADGYMWCWAWAVNCGHGPGRGAVACINGLTDRTVATSFADFVAQYLRDPKSVV